jgi:predicted adenine nucleotide alpha hydrolase (AANH) superfamily ATPase
MAKGMEMLKEGGERCFKCYNLRLEKAAQMAKEMGMDYFCTTLTLSPLKSSYIINKIGNDLQNKYQVKYLFSDFKKRNGYLESIKLSKEYNLYRQDYCGCIYSKRDRDLKKREKEEQLEMAS